LVHALFARILAAFFPSKSRLSLLRSLPSRVWRMPPNRSIASASQIVESRDGLKERFNQGLSSLTESAAQVIRERVDRKAAELMETARSRVQVGVDNASQVLEGTIENLTRSSAPKLARPIVSSLSQLLLFAFVETFIHRVTSERSRVRN
jgi:hypothetical protein